MFGAGGFNNFYTGMGLGSGTVFLLAIIMYFVTSYTMYRLAQKADYENAFFAFIPIANVVLMLNVAGMSGWWTLVLIFVPFINILFAFYVSFRFFSSFESGIAVFTAIIISAILSIAVPFVSIIGTIAVFWLALSDKQFVGELYEK